jgi:lipopolysaccharide export system protein LptA
MRYTLTLLSTIILLYWSCPALAENPTSSPILIEADRMESVQEKNAVMFSGHVEAKQDDLFIQADEMTVEYMKSQPDRQAGDAGKKADDSIPQQIRKLIAKGNVKVVQKDWVAVGDTMDFVASERKVILTGNAKAWQGKNMVAGDTIILFLDEGKSVVERSKKDGERVKAFIYPESESTDDKQ